MKPYRELGVHLENLDILLSDTNIILKIMLFEKIDLCNFEIPGYGKLKFHPIVQIEIKAWIDRNKAGRRVRKIEKFSLDKIEKALKKVRNSTQIVVDPEESEKVIIFDQYESILENIVSNSAKPSDEDLMILLHAEKMNCYMLTCDDILYKLGKKIIGKRSLELEDIFIALLDCGAVSKEDIRDYSALLGSYDELFKISKILK